MKRVITAVLGATVLFAASGYKVLNKIHVGGEPRWDYLMFDNQARRLYMSNSTRVVVFDVDAGKVVGQVPNTSGVHGIAVAPELNKGFTSNGRSNNVTVFDLKTLSIVGQVSTGTNPDSIVYDVPSGHVFTFNGRSNDSTAFDAKTGKVDATIPMGGKPEFSQSDGKGHIFVNIEDTHTLVDIDSKKMAVAKKYDLTGCEEPSGLAFDAAKRRLFSVCANKVMVISDPDAGKVIATVPIGAGADAAGFDPATGMAFSSNGEDGNLTIVQEVGGKWQAVDTIPTQRGSKTMTVDPKLHRVYLGAAEYGAPAAGKKGPTPVPDSFELLVVGK